MRVKKNAEPKLNLYDHRSVVLIILAVVLLVFTNTLFNDYNMDDEIVTINHPLTSKGISAIPEILTSPYFKSDVYSYEYRPIVHISFAVEHQFLGQSPFVSHLINLILYLLLVYSAIQVVQLLFPEVNRLILGAIVLLWALHPSHTEVIASIKNRDEILAFLFVFLSWKFSIMSLVGGNRWKLLLAVIFFNLAMGSKSTFLAFAFIIPASFSLVNTKEFNTIQLLTTFVLLLSGSIWFEQMSLRTQFYFISAGISGILFLQMICLKHAILSYLNKVVSKKGRFHYVNENSELKEVHTSEFIFSFEDWVFYIILSIIVFVFSYVGADNISFLYLTIASVVFFILVGKFWSGFINYGIIGLIIFLYSLVFLKSSLSIIGFSWLAYLLGYIFFSSPSKTPINKILSILCLLVILIITKEIFLILIFLLNYKKTVYFVLFVILAYCINLFVGLFETESFQIIDLLTISTLFSLFLVSLISLFSRESKRLFLSLICFVFVSTSFSFFEQKKPFIPVSIQTKNSITIPNDVYTSVIPTQSFRPILFAEFPIDFSKDKFDVRAGTSAEVLLRYLKLTLIPYPLSFYYGYAEIRPVSIKELVPILSVSIHLFLLIFSLLLFKRNKLIAFGILFYLISIAPFSAYFAPIPGVIADRYLFAPTLGFAFVLVGCILWLFKVDWTAKFRPIADFPKQVQYSLVAVLVVYSSLTVARNADWKDRLTLFQNDILHVPNSAQAHNLLAYHLNREAQSQMDPLKRKQMMENAALHFKRAAEIWPEFMNATYDYGRTNEQLGNWKEAVNAYRKTYEIDTSFSDAIFRMGVVYESTNNLDSAIISYKYVTSTNPLNIIAFNNLSYCYFKQNNYKAAIETGRLAYSYHPTNTDPMVNIGKTFLHINQNDSAVYYFEKIYPMRSDDKGLTEVLYKLWNEQGNVERAQFYYRRMQIMGMVK